MPTRSKDESRDHRRRTIRILVDYASDRGVRCDYATTLGAGGMFLESEDLLPDGSQLKLRFRVPNGQELHEIEGRVAWSRDGSDEAGMERAPGMGIQFTDRVAAAKLARELDDLE